ncbi:Cysteine-rich RLK (RECEPTOR-like protein kinase) 8, putative [Theobroma cacao]|uniref:Cysteine-rich RLK (RECEPTOR-like protein kinase) 8, putative n=1 Tax=Theobroma cacao TaxID=3641 RepID=A0A061F9D8_THECC|nr:Cysteine-rich RLK (RECEPTOR-like protein kinase) 8, putative [Theobroma cacao]
MELPQGYFVQGEYQTIWIHTVDIRLFIIYHEDKQWGFVAILVYVDDILIGSTSAQVAFNVKGFLSSQFKLKDLGKVKFFLGLEIARSPEGISICQRKYILDLLEEHGLLGTKPVSTPIDYNHKLSKTKDGQKLHDATKYRQLVGKLLYLTFTRPDISYAVQVLSQFMDKPSGEHFMAAYRVMKYLKRAPGQGILMKSKSNLKVSTYSDSDWAGCPDSRKFLTHENQSQALEFSLEILL